MAKKPKGEGKKYSYMDTYGDLVTLLMCFFVLLFAMSTVDETKYNAFVEALSNKFSNVPPANISFVSPDASSTSGSEAGSEQPTGTTPMDPDQTLPADFSQLAEAIEKFVAENNLEGEISVERGESGAVFIRLSENLLFAGDSSILQPGAMDFLDFLGECFIILTDRIFQVDLLGHTAEVPGSSTDDWMLANERSGRVASYLERVAGFSRYKMHTEGYGRQFPIADNTTDEGRARNRRVDIVVISNDADNLLAALAEASRIYFPGDDTQYFQGDPGELPGNTVDSAAPPSSGGVNTQGLTPEQLAQLQEAIDQTVESNSRSSSRSSGGGSGEDEDEDDSG